MQRDPAQLGIDSVGSSLLERQWSRRRFLYEAGRTSAGLIVAPAVGSLLAALAVSPTNAATLSAIAQSPAASAVVPKMGGTLNAAVSGNPDKLDPGTYALYGSRQLFGNTIFSNLLEMDSDGT